MELSRILLLALFTTSFFVNNASTCSVEGMSASIWWLDLNVVDTDRGEFLRRTTTDITGILSASQVNEGLNGGPYFQASLENSIFTLSLNENYAEFEENETIERMSIQVIFSCLNGQSLSHSFFLTIIDTNNNDPIFTATSDTINFIVTPPLPPRYQLTSLVNQLIVRDIDLTTQKIEFSIEENEYFEIEYDTSSSPKMFDAIIRTTTFIRSLPEPITLKITATDVDQTGDPPRTTYANLRIEADDEFVFPEEPIFSQVFYLATYSSENKVLLQNPIYLEQGYDESVIFYITGEFAEYFTLVGEENLKTVEITSPLPPEVINSGTLLVELRATRQYTSGASATLVIQMPEELNLQFDKEYYEGTIIDNSLSLQNLILTQGYENGFEVDFDSTYFSSSIAGNVITVSMTSLPANIIEENSFLTLKVIATSNTSSASTVVLLEIIKDDVTTPVFQERIYTGSYDMNTGLSLSSIVLIQGFDNSVQFHKEGEYESYFNLVQVDQSNVLNLQLVSNLPEQVLMDNQQILLTVIASKPRTVGANTAISVSLPSARILSFDRPSYTGQLEGNVLTLETVLLSNGYAADVTFSLVGEHESFFDTTNNENEVTVHIRSPIPDSVILNNNFLTLTLEALGINTLSATTNIFLEIIKEDANTPVFGNHIYYGEFQQASGVIVEDITLSQGYDSTVTFELFGEYASYFSFNQNDNHVSVWLQSDIPEDIISKEKVLLFNILAKKLLTVGASAAIAITIPQDITSPTVLRFEKNHYVGQIENDNVVVDNIIISEGYNDDTTYSFNLFGDLEAYFVIESDGATVALSLTSQIPDNILEENRIIVLELEVSALQALSAYTTIILKTDSMAENLTPLMFAEPYYTGVYKNQALEFESIISLQQGYSDDVKFLLEAEFEDWFALTQNGNAITITLKNSIPTEVLLNNHNLIFTVTAQNNDLITAKTSIVISLEDDSAAVTVLKFDSINYQGQFENQQIILEPMILSEGYSDAVSFTLQGELSDYFNTTNVGPAVTLNIHNSIPEDILADRIFLVVDIIATSQQAISARATIILTISINDENVTPPVFSEIYYVGNYDTNGGLKFENEITLQQGYDNTVQFALKGDDAKWFKLQENDINSVVLVAIDDFPVTGLPEDHLSFSVTATKPGTVTAEAGIFILIRVNSSEPDSAAFDKTLYLGTYALGEVQHETIAILDYDGSLIVILGVHSELFVAEATSGIVLVRTVESTYLPKDTTHVALELNTGSARAVLVLEVTQQEVTELPNVTFSASSYQIRTDISQTGLIGRVQATADNGERLTYTLLTDNAHLQERLSVSEEGDLHLFAPANIGVYSFSVAATTLFTQVSTSTMVHMTVDAIVVCGNDDRVLPPLLVLNRNEEEPHNDLVVLDETKFAGCWFSLSNRWPLDQDWLFVDETGLHARAIDREHTTIAFMAQSQIQVELILHCDMDNSMGSRTKRSLNNRVDWLGPYDYGNNKWVLTDTITYNSRRSFVNLIVNDINDNDPVFEGKQNEPIAVGYPVSELLDVIMPRALVELQATDADIGENAALLYWSSEPQLAVSPTTGTVHVRDNERSLEEGMTLVVQATDRNGAGNTGSIQLVLRLLDLEHIAVITVRDAFLDDEAIILNNLTNAIGYEVRVLTSTVTSDDYKIELVPARKKRQVEEARGVSLQLYIYGLDQRNPVDVNKLTSDINSNLIASAVVVQTVSLQDYLESREICDSERETGLLVATIVLSALLFIIIILIALWYFFKWRKDRNYNNFSDENSLTSRTDSVDVLPKPDTLTRPRLGIDELKRSERRLREMLDAPIDNVNIEPNPSSKSTVLADTQIDMPVAITNTPIIIQTTHKLKAAESDDDDEFGEVKNRTGRKSVVTFNEVVEKIIHVDDRPDTPESSLNYEVERL